ncbi:TIGR04104 family putative zinc finger protein [Ornithinibacillus sp. 4-3]|uniref:TIGR04104 family putative zinc finger protein n=1 Tax=Ornithinibacillus sp. 4-3 TaxID=3231488 RepID=A0AB39HIN3_9BACI
MEPRRLLNNVTYRRGIKMPTCQYCGQKWSWKQTFKQTFRLDNRMTCSCCGKKQYLTKRARLKSTFIPFSMVTLVMISNLVFGPSYIAFFILLCLLPLFLGIYPFFVELSKEEEPLF